MRWRLRRFFYTLLVLAVIVLVAFLMLRSRYREIVTELAETQVKNATSDLTNDALPNRLPTAPFNTTASSILKRIWTAASPL